MQKSRRTCPWTALSAVFVTTLALLFVVSVSAIFAGRLEPLAAVPVPEQNPQTPEKIELGNLPWVVETTRPDWQSIPPFTS